MTNDGQTTPPPSSGTTAPPAASTPTSLAATFDVTGQGLVRAVTIGALSYAATWVAGLVCSVLVTALLTMEDVDGTSWWWLLTAPGQLVAMAFRSPAGLSVASGGSAEGMGATTADLTSTAPALTLLLVALVVVFRLSRREETAAPSTSTKAAVTLAAVTAVTFVAIAWLLALVLKISLTEDGETAHVGAAGIQLILIGVAAITLVALVGRREWNSWPALGSVPLAARGAWRAVLVHLAVFAALVVPVAVIYVVVEGEAELVLALPLVAGNLLVWALTIGHLGTLTASNVGAFLGETDTDSTTFWIFAGDTDTIVWVLLPIALVATLAAAVVLHHRGASSPRTTEHWVWGVLVFGAVGGALTVLGTVSAGYGSGYGIAAAATFGPAAWFLLAFAAWGALAELLARAVGPGLSSALPDGWVARAAGRNGAVRVPGPARPVVDGLPGVPPPPPPPGQPALPVTSAPAAPMDPRSKKILIGIGASVAVIAVAVVGVSIANNLFFGPEKQIKEYFAALGDGDAERALDLARLDYSSNERALLTDEIFGASDQKIEDVDVRDVHTQGDGATATVTYTIDGAEKSQDVVLAKSGSRFVVFDDWELLDPGLDSLRLRVTGPATGLEVNGVSVDVDGLEDGVSLPAFPGTYEVVPTSDSSYVTFEPQTTTTGEDQDSLDFELAATTELEEEVTRQANAFLATCIASTEADPEGCPNDTYAGYDLKNVAWTLDSAPAYELVARYGGEWDFQTTTDGSATITARRPSFLDDEPDEDYRETVDVRLSGKVLIDGDTVTLELDQYF